MEKWVEPCLQFYLKLSIRYYTRGSILGPLLFSIYVCGMFYEINDCDIASYTDDNTPCTSSSNLDAIITN